jgi:3-hydroxymyristoyl/3-hydroxydecanoyl-(acyl carrier protein) dehydratase
MSDTIEIHFAPDHPTAAGHFPGNPIIPGAILLDEVIRTLPGGTLPSDAAGIRSAKFFHPVRPGDRVQVQWTFSPPGAAKFECRLAETLVAAGMVETGEKTA